MKAVVFDHYKSTPTLREVDRPKPGPGEVLLKVAGAGACHSDIAIFRDFDEEFGPAQLRPSFVLGHESSGWAEELGEGVEGSRSATRSSSTDRSAAATAAPARAGRTRTARTPRRCRTSARAWAATAAWPST
jgi:D-arabinose 1-dehydrogenase-like Zn-dependent alcohol dehydrogenase